MARLALAGVSLLTGRVDPAVPLIDGALQSLDWIPADRLVEVGELLVAVADTGWAKNEFSIVARVSAALNQIAVISGDPLLLLMAEKVDCESGLPTRDFAVTAARAEELYERGKSIGNLLVQWEAGGMRQIVCVLSDDPATGIIGVDRLIATYLPLRDGGGGAFLEALANFAALTGDADTAIPLYAASQVDARRSGLYWPIQLQSDTLLDRMRQQTAPDHFGELWTDGERLTLEDVARSRAETTR